MKENTREESTVFEQRITSPLRRIVGETLVEVEYFYFDAGEDEFSAESPNDFSILELRLQFDQISVRVFPYWRLELGSHRNRYHIELVVEGDLSGPDLVASTDLEWVNSKCENDVSLWRHLVLQSLLVAEIHGNDNSPQALRLLFTTGTVVICLGNASISPPRVIGDSDEMLVLDDLEWRDEANYIFKPWRMLLRVEAGIGMIGPQQ